MSVRTRHPDARPRGVERGGIALAGRAFTLAELLVAMAIIALLTTVTVVAVQAIARDARLSSAKNTVTAALDNARALAMRRNAVVLLAFRPRLEGEAQHVEIVTAEWSGQTLLIDYGAADRQVVDRFVPIADVAVRALAEGVGVAGPGYFDFGDALGDADFTWTTQVYLPVAGIASGEGERSGSIIGVMYAPDGTVISRNSASDSNAAFVDFNADNLVREYGVDRAPFDPVSPSFPDAFFFKQKFEDDEAFVTFVPFLAIYDDEEARENRVETDWLTDVRYEELLGSFNPSRPYYREGLINVTADRVHFNRYTGVVLR